MVSALGEQNSVYGSFLNPYQSAQSYVLGPSLDPYLRPKTDEDSVEFSKKQKDPEKRKKAVLGLSISLGVAALIVTGSLLSIKNPKAREDLKKLLNGTITQLGENEKLKEGVRNINAAVNFSNAKDVYTKKLFSVDSKGFRTIGKILRKFDEKASELYEWLGKKSVKRAHGAFTTALDLSDASSLEKLAAVAKDSPKDAELVSKITKLIQERKSRTVSFTNNFDRRFEEILSATEGIDEKVRAELEKCIKKGGDRKKLLNTFISEDILRESKEKFGSRVVSEISGIKSLSGEIEEGLRALNIDTATNSKALKKLEKALTLEGNDLFDKMRDIKMGCAPTDLLGAASAVGGLGLYLSQADTKEERTSATLRNGLPIIAAIGVSLGSAASMVSGIKSMFIGLGTGFVASRVFGAIDKVYRKKHNIDKDSLPNVEDVMGQLPFPGSSPTKQQIMPEMITGSRVMPDNTVHLQIKGLK